MIRWRGPAVPVRCGLALRVRGVPVAAPARDLATVRARLPGRAPEQLGAKGGEEANRRQLPEQMPGKARESHGNGGQGGSC